MNLNIFPILPSTNLYSLSLVNNLPNKYLVEDINSSDIKWIYRSGRWNPEYNVHNNRIIRKTFNAFFNGYEERNSLSYY